MQVPLGLVGVGVLGPGPRPLGDGEHPQPLGRQAAAASAAPAVDAQRARTVSGAPFTYSTPSAHTDIRRRCGSKANRRAPGGAPASVPGSPEPPGERVQGRLHRVADGLPAGRRS